MQNETLEGFMLSVHQQHLWSLQQHSLAYHAQCAICIEGKITTDILEESLQKVINRHGIFRTIFCRKAGIKKPIQVIHAPSNILCNYINLSHFSTQDQYEKVEEISQKERHFVFQLDKNLLLRSYLLTLSTNKQILLLTMPSLYADRWTLKNLLQEISDTYTASLKDEELSDEPLQYVQFCEWQNELITEEDAETGRAYWQQQKLWELSTPTLPFEGKHNDKMRFEPEVHSFKIDPDIFTQIKAITTLYNTTIAEFLFACWQTLFWRITGHSNIVISTVFSGRKYEELHEVMGLLAKWLPVRCPFQEDFKFTEVLSQIGETLGNHHKWQEYFLWEENAKSVVETVDLPISFEFEEWPNQYNTDGVSFSLDKQYVCFDPFKVKLTCVLREESLTVEFHYNTELICQESIQSLGEQFKTLVESAANNPQAKVNELEILNSSERQRLLVELNSTQTNYTQDKCIQHLFEKQVEKTPDNIAVVFENQQLTYRQLNKFANQLAHYLQQLGVGPEVLVAICLERSAEIVIALLAVLKAGGAYLPIDPALPTQGLTFRLQDTQAPVLLTQQSLLERLPELATRVVCLDPSAEVISKNCTTNPITNLTTENLAYVLYTSGSTGFPKGVAIEHRQILNYLYAILEKLELPDGSASFATVSTIAADLGNTAIFSTLCTGGCLHIISQERASDPKALGEYFHRYPIDYLKIVPSHLRTLLASSPTQSILPRQRLILGGEAASWGLIAQIQQQTLDCQILNHYGPTETTVGVTTFAVNGIASHNEKTVPIGRPLANTQVYVLDKKMRPVPVGVPGDLYISGFGLARGYLNRPELTSEKFIPNPFSDQPGSRLYKTGDLVRYFSDGNLEFLRRIDNQVKIRGYRIELEEIEKALAGHPGVRQVVVIDREDEPGNKCLVSYVVLQPGQALNVSNLKSFLREKLPEYMVPSGFVLLKLLPLNPNGKVDRQALPAPQTAQPEIEEDFVAPRTPIEEVLAGIWIQILNISSVGIHHNFFDLGGHSLLATQVISQVREAFQIELPLRSLFDSPTVAKLAEDIALAMKAGQRLEAPPIKRVSQEAELPLSFAQARLWFLNELQPDSSTYNMWATISLTGILNITALAQSFNEIVRRHAILRTTFASSAGQPVQRVAPNLSLVFPVVDLQHFPYNDRPFEVDRLATQEARQPFDLATGPLVRVTLLRLAEAEHVLLLTMHHIVSDGWSTGVLIRELATLYKAFLTGQPSLLPELPIQYTDFAVWQRRWLTGEVLESQLAYWRQHLEGAVPMLLLPTDRPRPSVQTFRGARQSFSLSTHLTERLKVLSRQERVTLFMTLLAAFKILLHRYSGQDDIVVGSPIANRNRTEIEELIGFFVNTLVLRTQLSGNPSFLQLLGRLREVALGAYNHQDLPFEYLVEVLQPERNLSHNPLFQVMFVLQNDLGEELKLPDLSLQSVEKESWTAKFDLTLSIVDSEPGLLGTLEYNTDLFNASTITRMLGHFQTLLEGIVANPEQHLLQLPFLTTPERQQLLVEWNDTQADYPKDQCIHQLFEIQVEHTPDAVAVVFESEQLTYCELNARANQLAHHLRTLGVEPEVLVGIYVERSLDMVIGLLGILKAGGAYVPLDPTYPQERLAFILEDAQVPVLLTQGRLVEAMPQHKAKVICLDTDWQTIAQESKENSVSEVTANNLAYVIYTSGSTGRPKGVMIKHQSTVAMLDWAKQIFAAEALLGVLASTSICFDLSVFEIFVPLNNGGKVILVENALHLPTLPTAKNVTLINTVPSIIAELLRTDGIPASVHTINIAGEPLQNQLVQQLHRWDNIQQVFNLYGPSEYTTYSTVALIQKGTSNIPPIGGPINNTQVYLLDQKLQLVPVGVLGELYIGGDGLARGYLNRPELTAEKFIPNPFTDKSAARLYKTGDLARYLPNGDIEYIGRIDYQVKIRGFRIELSEIEVVLSQHPDVLQNVIIVREDSPGDQRLVAYLVVKQESAPTLNDLRRFLTQQLPKYMIPSAWVLLEALPLTPNGKVNRQALPVPNQTRPKLEVAHEAPKTDLERTILKVWQEVLHVEEIGIHDNFFDLGGHSLLLVEVHEKLRKMLKLDFYMVVMFQYPTINSLAKHFCHGQSEQFDLHQSDDGQENRIALRKHRKQIRQEHRAGEK